MSIFNELLPKLTDISKDYVQNFNDDLKAVYQCFHKFEEVFKNGKSWAREKAPKDKNLMMTLQSINEDEDEPVKAPETEKEKSSDDCSSLDSNGERRGSKKRSKNEVDGILSPEQDKRQKRNASVKAQSIISKQVKEVKTTFEENVIILDTPKRVVNVNLTQKLRREEPADKSKSRRRAKDDDKENMEPATLVQIKQEKISVPPEPMDMEALNIEVKTEQAEANTDEIAMPPPVAPIPKPRKALQKDKSEESTDDESTGSRRRTTRTRKQTDTLPAPAAPAAASRTTRASSRTTKQDGEEAIPDARPKRTRAKKKAESESSNADTEKEVQAPQENGIASPAEKPRPKRTRRGQKAAENEETQPSEPPKLPEPVPVKPKPTEPEKAKPIEPEKPVKPTEPIKEPLVEPIQLKQERITQPETVLSPIIQPKIKVMKPKDKVDVGKVNLADDVTKTILVQDNTTIRNLALEETRIIAQDFNVANGNMDKTVVLPNGVYNHAPVTPKAVRNMNETVVLETVNRETMVLEKAKTAIMDATVVIEKADPKAAARLTDDDSLITDDSDALECTPPKPPPNNQPTSAVKEKVQQFEELASRVTRTKTRAIAKKQEEQADKQTPPDKISKAALSADTLTKMNNMIFNGKAPQISTSASKPRTNIVTQVKSFLPASTSKLSGINKAREAADQQKREREDAKRKKDALLEAKRELQKRKREEKMAAAAAAREQAEKERRAAMELAARERMEKQAQADLGKLERLKEAERKKQELARKVAETEERRKAEELARQQRLAEEQRRADAVRKKQLEEAEAMKKEEAIMAREMEKRKKEYIEKKKLKQRLEGDKISTPLKIPGTPSGLPLPPMEPVYMEDGFQYLNSDEEAEDLMPEPAWSNPKARRAQLCVQARLAAALVDRLFSVRALSPDLREIFPGIERARLKRTSSAVWRTPPRLPALPE